VGTLKALRRTALVDEPHRALCYLTCNPSSCCLDDQGRLSLHHVPHLHKFWIAVGQLRFVLAYINHIMVGQAACLCFSSIFKSQVHGGSLNFKMTMLKNDVL
jgi:hypothetical protein